MWLLRDVNYSLGHSYEVSGSWKFDKSGMKYKVIYDAKMQVTTKFGEPRTDIITKTSK